jgi:hypothetical protein
MANGTIAILEYLISDLENQKADYYAENNNQTDSHTMYLVGQIDGYKSAIRIIKG